MTGAPVRQDNPVNASPATGRALYGEALPASLSRAIADVYAAGVRLRVEGDALRPEGPGIVPTPIRDALLNVVRPHRELLRHRGHDGRCVACGRHYGRPLFCCYWCVEALRSVAKQPPM